MRNRNDQWVEEQKANFEMTYLQPLKIRQNGSENPNGGKPQAKTIKSGRLVKLPIVQRNKERAKAGMAFSSFPSQVADRRGYGTGMAPGRSIDVKLPKTTEDESVDSHQSSQGSAIINIQLTGALAGNNTRRSSEDRYESNDEQEALDFGALVNGGKITREDIN